jgi:hypothetical protein
MNNNSDEDRNNDHGNMNYRDLIIESNAYVDALYRIRNEEYITKSKGG